MKMQGALFRRFNLPSRAGQRACVLEKITMLNAAEQFFQAKINEILYKTSSV
jgi:hypothetical protein